MIEHLNAMGVFCDFCRASRVHARFARLKARSLAMQMQQGGAAFANNEQIALAVEGEALGLKAYVTGQLGEFGVADRTRPQVLTDPPPNPCVVKPRTHS